MKNKRKIVALLSIYLFAGNLVACNKNSTGSSIGEHECRFYHVDAVEPTCVSQGNVAYDQCPYCKKIKIDGKEALLEDTILPIDTVNGHKKVSHEAVSPTCGTEGMEAYDVCSICNKVFTKDGKETNMDALRLPATGNHSYDENGVCSGCFKSFKMSCDGENYTMDASNLFSLTANDYGFSTTNSKAEEKAKMASLIHANPFSVITQITKTSSTRVQLDESGLTINHLASSNTTSAFSRFVPGVKKADGSLSAYIGKFLFSYDVTIEKDSWVDRIGSMLADDGFNVLKTAKQSLLLGKNSGKGKFCEGNPERKFEAGATYRFVYEMEIVDANTLIQMFTCGNVNKFVYSNFHLVPLTNKKNVTSSNLIYFGKIDMAKNEITPSTPDPDPTPNPDPTPGYTQKKNYKLVNDLDFFKADDWTKANDSTDASSYSSELYDPEGNIVIKKSTASRIGLFHVANLGTKEAPNFIHPADNASKKDLTGIFNTEYTYKMDLTVNGETDLGILGSSQAISKETKDKAAFYLTFKEDGSLSYSQSAGHSSNQFFDAFTTEKNLFTQNNKFTFTIKMYRLDKNTLTISYAINNKVVKFVGEEKKNGSNISFSFDENGTFTSKGYLATTGMGQRFSVLPKTEEGKVIISSFDYSSSKKETQEEMIDPVEVVNPSMMAKGLDFFDAMSWTKSVSGGVAYTSEELKDGNNLVFNKDVTGRVDLFHVSCFQKDGKTTWIHPADSANSKKSGNLSYEDANKVVYNHIYRFDFDIQATSDFDMMILGSAKAFNRSSLQNSYWMNFAKDGTLTLSQTGAKSQFAFDSAFSSKSDFKMNQVNRFTILMERKSASEFSMRFAVNNKVLLLEQTGTYNQDLNKDVSLSIDEKHTFHCNGLFNQYGLGQRFGIFPLETSVVTLSGMKFTAIEKQASVQ